MPRKKAPACCADMNRLFESRFFKALCDPNRICLLTELAKRGKPVQVGELATCCPVDLSVVSRHLSILKDAGIVAAEKRGRQVFYSVRHSELAGVLRAMADAIESCCR